MSIIVSYLLEALVWLCVAVVIVLIWRKQLAHALRILARLWKEEQK